MITIRAAAFAIAVIQATQSNPDVWLVERGRVGPIALGASAHAVYEQFRTRVKLVDLQLEGMLSPALEVRRFGQQTTPSLIAELGAVGNDLVVTRIQVVDPALRTKDGIGIGSTFAELRAKYTVDWIGSGEGSVFARVEALGISFQLDQTGQKDLWKIREPSKVPGEVRISSMLVTR